MDEVIETLQREQYGIEEGCSQPEYRRGWNHAMRRALEVVQQYANRVEEQKS